MPATSADPGIHIALTFDDGYWAPAYAVMRSVCIATKRRRDVVFHLCHHGLAPEHRQDLDRIASEFGCAIRYYDLGGSALFGDIATRMPYNARLTNIVYARLIIDRLIDPAIGRLLYLDCDVLVRAPVERLYDIELGGSALAAVQDSHAPYITARRDLLQNRDLFDLADPYFNAGVLLIDVAQWREADILGRMEATLKSGVFDRIYYDQDLLNLIFAGRWLELDSRWNIINPRKPHEALNCFVYHYTGDRKPWHLLSGVAHAQIYRHTMTNALFYRYMRFRWAAWWRGRPRAIAKWLRGERRRRPAAPAQ